MKIKIFTISTLMLMVGLAFALTAQAAINVTVTPTNTNGWVSFQETANGTSTFVSGPGTTPLGTGSAQFTVDSTGGVALATFAHVGTPLSNITNLSYNTYRATGSAALAPSLQLEFDANGLDATTTWQGRLVYEPYFTQTVNTGTWQNWNTLATSTTVGTSTATSTGNWWFSNAALSATCSQANPCTWAEVLTAFPNASIRNAGTSTGAVLFKAGGGWTGGFTGNVDAFTIGVSGNNTTYDFEATTTPMADTTAPAAPTHLSPANNTSTTSASLLKIDWTDVTDASSSPVVYYYEISNSSSTNANGSFVSAIYQSGALTMSEISTVGTPEGTYYWHVRAADSVGNLSDWTSAWKIIVDNNATTTPPNPTHPTNKDQCKNGGWKTFTNPSFKNQGQCVSSTNHN